MAVCARKRRVAFDCCDARSSSAVGLGCARTLRRSVNGIADLREVGAFGHFAEFGGFSSGSASEGIPAVRGSSNNSGRGQIGGELCPHRRHERLDTHDVHDAGQSRQVHAAPSRWRPVAASSSGSGLLRRHLGGQQQSAVLWSPYQPQARSHLRARLRLHLPTEICSFRRLRSSPTSASSDTQRVIGGGQGCS